MEALIIIKIIIPLNRKIDFGSYISNEKKKMTAQLYNPKIYINGEYAPIYGWSVIAMVNNDMKFIENYIKNHRTLNQYFSALPSESYHMTLYNIWCNGSPLLPHQQRFLKQNYDTTRIRELMEQASRIGEFNPDGCMDAILYKMFHSVSNSKWGTVTLTIKKVHYNGNTIRISLQKSSSLKNADVIRRNMTQIAEREDGMGSYHITLGYKYSHIEDEGAINAEVAILDMLLTGQTVTLNKPIVAKFDNMKYFSQI